MIYELQRKDDIPSGIYKVIKNLKIGIKKEDKEEKNGWLTEFTTKI